MSASRSLIRAVSPLLACLGLLGLWHSRRTPPSAEILAGHTSGTPDPARV